MRAVLLRGVLDLALFILVAALALVHPELLGHGVFHGAGVLPAHLVVRNPPVLRCAFAVGCEFRFVVDLCLGVVVFHPAGVPQVPHVHVQPLEADAGGHDAVEFVGLDLGVEQAVAQRRAVDHLGLAAGYCTVALQGGEVAPDGGGEQVSGEVLSGQALQDGGALGLWRGLGLLQFLLGRLHSGLEGLQLRLADALDGQADGGLLACNEWVLGFVPVLLPIAGVASLPYGFAACAHAGAGGHGGAVQAQFGFEVDAAAQAGSPGGAAGAQDGQAVDEPQAAESAGVCAQASGAPMQGQMCGRRIHE